MNVSSLAQSLTLLNHARLGKEVSIALLKQKHAMDQAMVQAIAQSTQQANAQAKAVATGHIDISV